MMSMRVANDEHVPDSKKRCRRSSRTHGASPSGVFSPRTSRASTREVEREGIDRFEQVGQEVVEVLERLPSAMMVVREWVVVGLAA